jgi:hypothetical protein
LSAAFGFHRSSEVNESEKVEGMAEIRAEISRGNDGEWNESWGSTVEWAVKPDKKWFLFERAIRF